MKKIFLYVILFLLFKVNVNCTDFDKVFKLKKQIILQQSEKSFIGSVRQCYIENNKIIINDPKQSNVKIYDFSGKLIHILGSKGIGPGEFKTPIGLDANDSLIFISDISNRRVNIFNKNSYMFINSFPILDGRELKIYKNKIYLSYVDISNNKSIHEYSTTGKKIKSLIEIPKIMIDNQLIADMVYFDFDRDGNIYSMNEMQYEILKGKNEKYTILTNDGGSKYISPPIKPFRDFYSKEKTLKWLDSWTHIMKLIVENKSKKLVVFMRNKEEEGLLNIHGFDGKIIKKNIRTNMRLLCTDNEGNIYFLDEQLDGNTIKFIIKQYSII